MEIVVTDGAKVSFGRDWIGSAARSVRQQANLSLDARSRTSPGVLSRSMVSVCESFLQLDNITRVISTQLFYPGIFPTAVSRGRERADENFMSNRVLPPPSVWFGVASRSVELIALRVEKFEDLARAFGADARHLAEVGDRGPLDLLQRAEMVQQRTLA
jgi:hypothetical protein